MSNNSSEEDIKLRFIVRSIIVKIWNVRTLQPLTTERRETIVEDWLEVLGNEIPSSKLFEIYLSCIRERDCPYPLGVEELLSKWRKLKFQEKINSRKISCRLCPGDGIMIRYDPIKKENVVLDCPRCRK